MPVRHNLCVNPYLKNNATGWGGGGGMTPTRADLTGLGFGRTWGARVDTGGSYVRTASGAITAGQTYTISFYIRPDTTFSGSFYLTWVNGSGSDVDFTQIAYSASSGTVTRVSGSGTTAHGDAVTLQAIIDGTNRYISQVLIELGTPADSYFDGDDTSLGGSWDGADGNSASTLSPGQTVILGQAVETSSALGLAGRAKTRTLGQPSETSTALTLGARAKKRTLGQALELDTALALQSSAIELAAAAGAPHRGWSAGAPARRWAAGAPH
jgi:hypothetical protein